MQRRRRTMKISRRWIAAAGVLVPAIAATLATAGVDCPVVLVVNQQSSMSRAIGDAYQYKRLLPPENVVHLSCTVDESISREDFDRDIRAPLQAHLETYGLRESTKYLVLTKGCPLKVSSASGGGTEKTGASLCGELALLFRTYPLEGLFPNPYFAASEPFDRAKYDIYLVTRLDGFPEDTDGDRVPDDVVGLIERAFRTGLPDGEFLLDLDPYFDDPPYSMGNDWIREASRALGAQGARVRFEGSWQFIGTADNLLGYTSWGSHDGQAPDDSRQLHLHFLPGSIATTFESFNAVTMNDWRGYGQWLLADLIHAGLTGAVGNVDEPYLNYVARPSIFLPRYHEGYPLAEAFYMSIPYLSWQVTVIGDPLCPSEATFGGPTPTPTATATPLPEELVFAEAWDVCRPWSTAVAPEADWGSNDPGFHARHATNEDLVRSGPCSGWWYAHARLDDSGPQRYVWARRRVSGLVPGATYRLSFWVATKGHDWPHGYLRFGYDWSLEDICTDAADPQGLVAPGTGRGSWNSNEDIDARCAAAGYGTFVHYVGQFVAEAPELDLWGICRRTLPAADAEWTEMFVDDIRIETGPAVYSSISLY